MDWMLSENTGNLFCPDKNKTLKSSLSILAAISEKDISFSSDSNMQAFYMEKAKVLQIESVCSKQKFINWTMGRIELSTEEYIKLSKALNVSLDQLFGVKEFKKTVPDTPYKLDSFLNNTVMEESVNFYVNDSKDDNDIIERLNKLKADIEDITASIEKRLS